MNGKVGRRWIIEHGDLLKRAIQTIPEAQVKDTVLIDPTNTGYPVVPIST